MIIIILWFERIWCVFVVFDGKCGDSYTDSDAELNEGKKETRNGIWIEKPTDWNLHANASVKCYTAAAGAALFCLFFIWGKQKTQ